MLGQISGWIALAVCAAVLIGDYETRERVTEVVILFTGACICFAASGPRSKE